MSQNYKKYNQIPVTIGAHSDWQSQEIQQTECTQHYKLCFPSAKDELLEEHYTINTNINPSYQTATAHPHTPFYVRHCTHYND
jgi:hypothetical protein